MALVRIRKKLLAAARIAAALVLPLSTLSAQETLPEGYSYAEGTVPLVTPGVELVPVDNSDPNELMVLNGVLLNADDQGTAAIVSPLLRGANQSVVMFSPIAENTVLGTTVTGPGFRILVLVPDRSYPEHAFLEIHPVTNEQQVWSDRFNVEYHPPEVPENNWLLGCYRFALPATNGEEVKYYYTPSPSTCHGEARTLEPETRKVGSYWLMASSSDGVLTPALVLQSPNALIDFDQPRGTVEPAQDTPVKSNMAWSFFRFQGLDAAQLPFVNVERLYGADHDAPISVGPRDLTSLFEEVTEPVGIALSEDHLLVALPETPANKGKLAYSFSSDSHICATFQVSIDKLSRNLEDARLTRIDVSCTAKALEFTVEHDAQHTLAASLSGKSVDLEATTGARCASSLSATPLAANRTATCFSGAQPGETVSILAEATDFEDDTVIYDITDENAYGGIFFHNPQIRLKERYISIAIDAFDGAKPTAIDWASVISFSTEIVDSASVVKKDSTGLVLRIRFGMGSPQMWRATKYIEILFTLNRNDVVLEIDGKAIASRTGGIQVPMDLMQTVGKNPQPSATIAEGIDENAPRISLRGTRINLPGHFDLQLRMPSSDDEDLLPNRICDVGLSVSDSEVFWLDWNPKDDETAKLPVAQNPHLAEQTFAMNEPVKLFARASKNPAIAEVPYLKNMSEGVCPTSDSPFAVTTVGALAGGEIAVRPRVVLVYFIRSISTDTLYEDRRVVHVSRLEPVATLAKQRLVELRFFESSGTFTSIFSSHRNNYLPGFKAGQLYRSTQAPSLTPSLAPILRDAEKRRRVYGYADAWPPIALITSNWHQTRCDAIARQVAQTMSTENLEWATGMKIFLLDDRVAADQAPLERSYEKSDCKLKTAPNELQVIHLKTWRDGNLEEAALLTDFAIIYADVFTDLTEPEAN